MEKIKKFLSEVKQELRRVSWPDRDLALKATFGVIMFSLAIGLYLWVVDLILVRLVHMLLTLRGG
ncbi:preprotein translocase subunit SecE [Thermocrinis minervae]|uniref:Protein translocase subunit SecE n=1 Tax=Thermocrinis minervae TaxID=381751 RepID=A0A1M6RJ01_9AQUI|nr:preprotein translocase subunit SecE [Thermocrinis minervae]SHK32471.1 preprotein translocase subunit SecE [Thermocrinis minervae]